MIKEKGGVNADVFIEFLKRLMLGSRTCQKPLQRALERDESLVQQWLRREYPRIRALARREEAESGDAAHMRSDHHCGRTWGKKGELRQKPPHRDQAQ